MGSGDLDLIRVRVNAIGGTAPVGSSLRVRVLDTTMADAASEEVGSVTVPNWVGEALTVQVTAPPFDPGRDYVAFAHGGVSDDIGAGDWITTSNFPIVDRSVTVTLEQI